MKKIISKLKGKKVLSLVLAAIMLVTTFSVAVPMLTLDASAADPVEAGNTGEIKQDRVVGVSTDTTTSPTYPETYENYAANFLNGAGKATNIVIPGLNASNKEGDASTVDYNDWVVQGLSYYEKKDWIMVSVYHNDGLLPSMIFALDAKSGAFEYAFAIKNRDGENIVDNKDHGGGLAFSEYNFYYSGDDSDLEDGDDLDDANCIAYAPLDYFDNPSNYDDDMFPDVIIEDAVSLPEMGGAATAYVCYDEGILWAGNFYEDGIGGGNYKTPVIPENTEKGIALHNSMIYGYRLQGNSSEEEWAYLTGNKGNTSDHAGKPSHCIAVHTDYEDIQYAVVDDGKVYISRSWGTGENDDVLGHYVIQNVGDTPEYSTLTVGNIDLSVEGTTKIRYQTDGENFIETYAHELNSTNTKHFDMMPMSEGLCFIDGDLYISFEGASNKYMNEYACGGPNGITATGNCDYPIDVVWKVDPYKLMGEERQETREAVCFEKVTQLSDIKDDEEYIIVYESPEKNPVNQKNILYAFDAYGNFKDLKLSKSTDTQINGYDGMIGHPISEYSVELVDGKDRLYLTNSEKDDLPSLRWNIIDANAGEGKLRIQSPLSYYSSNRNFYFNADTISMTNDTHIELNPLVLEPAGDTEKFYLKNNKDGTYLWCNDFSVSGYEDAANQWYAGNDNISMYADITETKGTFHTDALKTGENIIGETVAPDYYLGQFSIYKCVVDEFSSTEKNRVYTDMSAELLEDGTYTVNLETYATSALHYKSEGNEKPTDFIFVLDTSASMATADGTGMIPYDGTLSAYSVSGEPKGLLGLADNFIGDADASVGHGDMYVKYKGLFMNISVEGSARGGSSSSDYYKNYWLYGTYDGVVHYYWPNNTTDATQGGEWKPEKPTAEQTMKIQGGSDEARATGTIYYGEHYRYSTNDYAARLQTLKDSACNIIDEIVVDAKATGLDHRFAVTQYGVTDGFYLSDTKSISTGTDYSKAFWGSSEEEGEALKNTINAISAPEEPARNKTFTYYGGNEFKYANAIIEANEGEYASTDSNGKNVAVIFISDGLAGTDSIQKSLLGRVTYTEGGTLTEANTVISQAKTAKENGAFIYTVLIGQGSGSEYDKVDYMEAVSSQYPEASAVDTLGGECAELTSYSIDLSKSTSTHYQVYVDKLVKDVKTNDSVGIEKLANETVIIEQLSDAFIIPDNYDYNVALYEGYYDCLDRFQFKETGPTPEELSIKAEVKSQKTDEKEEKWIVVTGYNYSEQYIANNHPGNKLKVTITGLLANPEANITNTSINNTDTTAIYKSSTSTEPFKYFPTEYFTIPEYTYVLDYGFDMYDSDVNGTIKALDDAPNKQRDDAGNLSYSTDIDSKMVEITNSNQDLIYRHNPKYAEDSGFVLIQRPDESYDWFEIKVVPASNVLYEETGLDIEYPSDNNPYHWNKKGSPTITCQDLSTENDVYGYDSNYANSTGFSNGTHYYSTVDKQNILSDVASVTFKGNGFELLAACGEKTGIQLVAIKKFDETENKWKTIKAYFTDTYYEGDMLADENALLYQVPVVKWEGTEYGEYKVEVSGFYASGAGAIKKSGVKNKLIDTGLVMNTAQAEDSINIETMLAQAGIKDLKPENVELVWFDDNSVFNGGTGPAPVKKATRSGSETTDTTLHNYVDGFRIYNPIEDTSNYIEKERDPHYINVLNNLMTAGDTVGNIAYIVGAMDNLTWGDYNKVGPQDEVYLKPGTAQTTDGISFNTQVTPGGRVMISLRAVNGATKAKINDTEIAVNSATEMYYDITDVLEVDNTNTANVTVINTGDGILSVNNIKLTNTVSAAKLMMFSADDLETAQNYASMEPVQATVENGVVTPVEEEEEIPEDNTNTEDDNTNDGTDTEGSTEGFSILSLIQMIIKLIESILKSAFGAGSIA